LRALALAGIVLGWTAVTLAYSTGIAGRTTRSPTATNYRGLRLPQTLGLGLVLLVFWVRFFHAGWIMESSVATGSSDRLVIAAALLLVFLVGWFDDYRAGPARGLTGHLKELARGRITSGMVKLVGIVGAAAWTSMILSDDILRILLGIPIIAGAANLWNLLDVRPGRALKSFLVAALVLVSWYVRYDDYLLPAAIGSGTALLVLDLRERAMLGDAGSNVLGFIIGLALFRLLPTWGLGFVLGVILILHALGETVTLSRIIEATPPLRWFDRLGRLPADQTKPESGSTSRDSSST
jgi:UDP-N-acetylmuramyl pentapeptide phosphotransferase/UDP-N-acetylglucosamine-1-phosphate transferase